MSTTTVETTAAATGQAAERAVRGRVRRRGEHGPVACFTLHTVLTVASLIAFFPVGWLVFLSLGPDKDDYLHPSAIWHTMTLHDYAFVLRHTGFFSWLKSTLVVSGGTTLLGVLLAAGTGYAVSRMRFPGHRKFMWLLLTRMFPIAVLIVPMYQTMSDPSSTSSRGTW